MPHHMYTKITSALNKRKSINGSKIFFLGVAYKPDISDDRIPALEIIDIVANKGGMISYNDLYPTIKTPEGYIQSVRIHNENLENTDIVIVQPVVQFAISFITEHVNWVWT